jgi:hypothetical protein
MRLLMAVLATLIIAASALAATTGWPEVWSVGVIQAFDPRARSLVVRQGLHRMTFALSPAADILEGRVALNPEALARNVGRRVKIRYVIVDEVKVADRVEIAGAR